MATRTIAGLEVEVDEQGRLADSSIWTEEMAAELAKEQGIDALTDAHWKVIHFLQADYEEKGVMPSIRRVKNAGGVPTKELYELFPEGPLKKATFVAGLPKPKSCI